jgi:F-type H+-transporting ATPase subunit epsilon
MNVHLVTPEREVWTGGAQMVVARGVEGMVGILPGHAPLLIRLAIAVMKIQAEDGSWQVVVVDGGFLHVTSGEQGTRVDVLATNAELASEIDARAAELRAEELRRRLAEHRQAEVSTELATALARASVHS